MVGLRAAVLAVLGTAVLADMSALSAEDALLMEGTDYAPKPNDRLRPCPEACGSLEPSNWTVTNSYERFRRCDEPLLFDFSLYNPVADPDTPTKIRTCTVGNAETKVNALFNGTNAVAARADQGSDASTSCSASKAATESSVALQSTHRGTNMDEKETTAAVTALKNLQTHFEHAPCDESVMFGYNQGVIAGVYIGAAFGRATVSSVITSLVEQIKSQGLPQLKTAHLCGEGRNANHVFGVVVGTAGNITAVQNIVRGWNEAECQDQQTSSAKSVFESVPVWEDRSDLLPGNGTFNNGTLANSTLTRRISNSHGLHRRGDCRTEKVIAGDGCGALATRCGISGADLSKYNTAKDLCSTLQPGQRVCCNAGTLPDIAPKPDKDGNCFAYTVKKGDNCAVLAAANGISKKDLETYNNGTTWGWYGCEKLLADSNICLSKGKPPLPYPIPNAVCGPLKPDSEKPSGDKELKDLNPCPLNACCNVWGQCGISGDFCTEKKSESGNPGTSGLRNGCVSNCGQEIKKGDAPGSYGRVGYYESWMFNRPCLHLHADNANVGGKYTIIHWAFAEINTNDWTVKINDTFKQWDKFKSISAKKVISFGGWGYSTEPATYNILRTAMNSANRDKFASNVAKFLDDNKLDGVDYDWEYPGAPDIDGAPSQPDDGLNYLKFLMLQRKKLGSGKSLSIAAPASYWYLKQFPIEKMAKELDYIVYMTYDLHGQWDAGNAYSIDGCEAGNCLRSHVNLTETTSALAMITKAGVPTNKIYVGESSYGRSFKMAKAGCTGPMCTFLGDRLNSQAKKGRCTETSGYISNAEIEEIIAGYDADPEIAPMPVEFFHDKESNSDILVYQRTEWVAYMSPTTKSTRRDHWQGYNFGGTIDWAVDLQSFTMDEWRDQYPSDDKMDGKLDKCTKTFDSMEGLDEKIEGEPMNCKPLYTLMGLRGLLKEKSKAFSDMMKDGYDHAFDVYSKAVAKSAGSQVETFMWKNGNKYFDCQVSEVIFCCNFCKTTWSDDECKYCHNDGCKKKRDVLEIDAPPGTSPAPVSPLLNSTFELAVRDRPPPGSISTNYGKDWIKVDEPCPPDFSKRGIKASYGDPKWDYGATIWWNLRKNDEEKFWTDLLGETGVDQKDVKFEDINREGQCNGYKDCKMEGRWDINFPNPKDYTKEDVVNPKDTANKGLDNAKNLPGDLDTIIDRMQKGEYLGDAEDVVDAVSLPIIMIADAVENMKVVMDVAHEIEEAERKAIIFAFLSALFFFIPIAGEVLGALTSMVAIARIAALIAELGAAAVDIAQIVDDPKNPALSIVSLIFAPLSILDIAKVGKAANVRRGMKGDDIKALGGTVPGRMEQVTKCLKGGTCKKR